MRTKQVNFRLEKELEAQARKAAAAQGLSIGQYFINLAKRDLGLIDDSSDNTVTQSNETDSTPSTPSTPSYLIDKVEELERLVNNIKSESQRIDTIEEKLYELDKNKISYSDLSFITDSTPSTDSTPTSTPSTDSTPTSTDSTDSTPTSTDSTDSTYLSAKTKAYKVEGYEGGEAIIPLDEIDTETEEENEAIGDWLYNNLGEHSISEDDVLEGSYNVVAVTSYARNSTPSTDSTNSKTDSSNSDSDSASTNSKILSATKLGERLGVSRTSVRKAKDKGADYFARWSQTKDPDHLTWEYNPKLNQYQVVEGDRADYKVNHKPSDDEHQISNGDKSPNGHQENAPSVEQLEKYPTRTP